MLMPELKQLILKQLAKDKQIVVIKTKTSTVEGVLEHLGFTVFKCKSIQFITLNVKNIWIGHFEYEITLS